MTDTMVITDPETDRYHTFGYISWWRHDIVRQATVLVVGAGALGNEVLKNLALMGIGKLIVMDFDLVEDGNLSRSILFRESDRGQNKALVAAKAINRLNPDVDVQPIVGDVNHDLGIGIFRHVDAVIGCLDNREARLTLNRMSWATGKPWVDGAIQEMMGIVRVFWPDRGACYECTLNDQDYQMINLRYSCPLLARESIIQGKVPTTPTSASIVAAFQTQEALKLIHSMEVEPGKALLINGLTNDIYKTEYPIKENCMSHARYEPIIELPEARSDVTLISDILDYAKAKLGGNTFLEFGHEIVVGMRCPNCGGSEPVFKRMARLYENAFSCPHCNGRREMRLTHRIDGSESYVTRTLAQFDVPALDIIRARNGKAQMYLEITGDKERYFGPP